MKKRGTRQALCLCLQPRKHRKKSALWSQFVTQMHMPKYVCRTADSERCFDLSGSNALITYKSSSCYKLSEIDFDEGVTSETNLSNLKVQNRNLNFIIFKESVSTIGSAYHRQKLCNQADVMLQDDDQLCYQIGNCRPCAGHRCARYVSDCSMLRFDVNKKKPKRFDRQQCDNHSRGRALSPAQGICSNTCCSRKAQYCCCKANRGKRNRPKVSRRVNESGTHGKRCVMSKAKCLNKSGGCCSNRKKNKRISTTRRLQCSSKKYLSPAKKCKKSSRSASRNHLKCSCGRKSCLKLQEQQIAAKRRQMRVCYRKQSRNRKNQKRATLPKRKSKKR